MFSDPITLSLYGGTNDAVFKRANQDNFSSAFRLTSNAVREAFLNIRHSKTKANAARPSMDRHNVEYVETIFGTPTVLQSQNKVYIVSEHLPGFDPVNLMTGLCAYLLASSSAAIVKLRDWEV